MPGNADLQSPIQGERLDASTGARPPSGPPGADGRGVAPPRVPYFEREHGRLASQLHEHLLDVAGGSFILARQHLQRWRRALASHIRIEDTRLLPHVPPGARWSARLYRLEHERITTLADAYAARVDAVSENPPRDERSRRETILALLDATHALRHLLEHHHQREEMALSVELPAALQDAAWGYGDGLGRRDEGR